MDFLKYSFITLLSFIFVGSAGYLYAASGMKSKPGYADLTLPSWSTTNTALALNLGPKGLKPVQWAVNRAVRASNKDLELSERLAMSILEDLQGVQLRVYEVEDNRPVFEQAIDESVALMQQEDWQTLLKVREDNKRIVVMHSLEGELISGLSVLVSTPENAIFMNLVGQIDPESVAMIALSLN